MRIAVSNIAWDPAEDEAAAALFARLGIDAIDIAPGKYFGDPQAARAEDVAKVRGWWAERGIEITGMQALLFGTSGLNVFGDDASRRAMLDRLAAVCRVGGLIGATRLVFGSPRNRDRSGLSDAHALERAVPFFRALGDRALDHGVAVCLEPNPAQYGCNFMTTTAEAAAVVTHVDHAGIRLNLDTGTLAINGEDATAAVAQHASLVGHVHASEADLVPVGDAKAPHAEVARELRRLLPGHVVSIEMLPTANEPHLQSIERAARFVLGVYGDAKGAP